MKKIIVALDVNDQGRAMELVQATAPWVDLYKVGPILFLKGGPDIVCAIKNEGKEVFLDLKFHDIPATVQRSVHSAQQLGVYSLTIHSSGGEEMIRAATDIVSRPKIWVVTVLTSQVANADMIVERALLAKRSGADGVIASPLEIHYVKKACGEGFTVVTPGIRLNKHHDDQKRVASPKAAVAAGADFIVIGRPIIEAKDPAKAAEAIFNELP